MRRDIRDGLVWHDLGVCREVWKDRVAPMAALIEEMTVVNPLGLHARPAATLVQRVLGFESDVYIEMNGHKINAKSIMGLLTLAAAQGSRLTVTCAGSDAEAAMTAIRELVQSGFGDKEWN